MATCFDKKYIEDKKKDFDFAFECLKSNFDGSHIIYSPNIMLADAQHIWGGDNPVHYRTEYYTEYYGKIITAILKDIKTGRDNVRSDMHRYREKFQNRIKIKYFDILYNSFNAGQNNGSQLELLKAMNKALRKISSHGNCR